MIESIDPNQKDDKESNNNSNTPVLDNFPNLIKLRNKVNLIL